MAVGTTELQLAIEIPHEALSCFCQKWNLRTVELFGSVVRENFRADSDVDVMVTFDSMLRPTLFEFVQMQDELEGIFGRKVDLLSRHAVEGSQNPYRKQSILESARIVYAK
jgi:hypothetical protein